MLNTTTFGHPSVLVMTLVLLAAVIWAVVVTIRDPRVRTVEAIVWTAVLVALPVIGLVIWFISRLIRNRRHPLGTDA